MMAAAEVAMGAKSAPGSMKSSSPYRAKRTEAMPKHTLFGAAGLELLDEKDKQNLKQLDIKRYERDQLHERIMNSKKYEPTVPDYMKPSNEASQDSEMRNELDKHFKRTSKARESLDLLELKSKYFMVGTNDNNNTTNESRSGLLPEVNSVGLSADGRGGYNHQKYMTRPPVHQYSLIGDPMHLGMDRPIQSSDTKTPYQKYVRAKAPDWQPKEAFMKDKSQRQSENFAVDVPPNIQHQFGTNVCRNVLRDTNKVTHTIDAQKRLNDSFYRRSQKQKPYKLPPDNIDPVYESLSHALRQNVIPGFSYGHKQSLCKSVYTQDVFDRRVADPEEYRYQRDELSTWAEQNVLRDRVKKAWDAYHSEQKAS